MDVTANQNFNRDICRAATRRLIRQINQHEVVHLKSIGMDNKLSSPLSRLSASAQEMLIRNAHHFFSFSLDERLLEQEIQRAEEYQAEYDMQYTFIALGATSKMMNELFGFHTVEYSLWRKRLNLEGVDNHRIRYCDEKTERAIWDLWEKYRHLPPREYYLKIAEESGQKLNLINNAIERYINGES